MSTWLSNGCFDQIIGNLLNKLDKIFLPGGRLWHLTSNQELHFTALLYISLYEIFQLGWTEFSTQQATFQSTMNCVTSYNILHYIRVYLISQQTESRQQALHLIDTLHLITLHSSSFRELERVLTVAIGVIISYFFEIHFMETYISLYYITVHLESQTEFLPRHHKLSFHLSLNYISKRHYISLHYISVHLESRTEFLQRRQALSFHVSLNYIS